MIDEGQDITITYLADHPDRLLTLAQWHHDEWHHLNPGDSLDKRIARMQGHLGRRQIPVTFAAFIGNTLLGSAALVVDDMHRQIDLTPWLASVFVAPQYRRRGVGRALVKRVVDEAQSLNVETLHLFTPDRERFYAHMGWQVLQRTTYMNEDVLIMSLPLMSSRDNREE